MYGDTPVELCLRLDYVSYIVVDLSSSCVPGHQLAPLSPTTLTTGNRTHCHNVFEHMHHPRLSRHGVGVRHISPTSIGQSFRFYFLKSCVRRNGTRGGIVLADVAITATSKRRKKCKERVQSQVDALTSSKEGLMGSLRRTSGCCRRAVSVQVIGERRLSAPSLPYIAHDPAPREQAWEGQ